MKASKTKERLISRAYNLEKKIIKQGTRALSSTAYKLCDPGQVSSFAELYFPHLQIGNSKTLRDCILGGLNETIPEKQFACSLA